MDYGKIVSTGWKQAWKHKTLWIFGFFVSGGGLNYMGDLGDRVKIDRHVNLDLYDLRNLVESNLAIILFLMAMGLLAFLVWIILSNISVGGLVGAAGQLKRGDSYSFTTAFKTGLHYFWRIFGLSILMIIVIFAFLIMLVIFGVIAFKLHTALGVLSLLFLLPILIVGIFVVSISWALANRFIANQDRAVFDAIGDGFTLWKSHPGPAMLYTLIYIAIAIGVLIATFIIAASIVLPFVAVAFVNLLLALLAGIPLVLLVLLVIDGFTGSAMHLMTTEFYFQLLEEGTAVAVATPPGYEPPPPPAPPPPSENP